MSRSVARVVLVVLMAAALPAVARAQFPRKPALPKVRLPGGSGGSAAKPVTYDETVLELTPARLDAALRAFAVEQREGPRIAAGYRRREASYQQALREWTARDSARKAQQAAASDCTRRATAGDQAQAQQQAQSMQARMNDPAVKARMKDLQARMQAAGQRQDMNTVMALSDTLRHLMGAGDANQMMQAQQARMGQAEQKCGVDTMRAGAAAAAADTEPTPPANPRDSVFVLAGAAGGFTPRQYAMVRERVLGYLSVDEDKLRASSWAFSQGELDALRARREKLGAYQPMLAAE